MDAIDRICAASDGLTFGSIEKEISGDPWMHAAGMDGSLTIVVRGDQLPERYRMAILAYRFAQYVKTGWVDKKLAWEVRYFSDSPTTNPSQEVHILVLDRNSGNLVGYLSVTNSSVFGVEKDYPVTVGEDIAIGIPRTEIWEPKRLLRRAGMPRTQLAVNAPWWALLGLTTASEKLTHDGVFQRLIGDGSPTGSPAMISALGYSVQTYPVLAHTENSRGVFGPLWSQETPAVIFEAIPALPTDPITLELERFLKQGRRGSVRKFLASLEPTTAIMKTLVPHG